MSVLTAKQIARLKPLGIVTDKEPIARKKLLAILTANDIPDCDGDTTDGLIEMALVFKDSIAETEDESAEVEEEAPALKKPAKKAPAKKQPEPEEEEETEEEEADEEEDMEELVDEVETKKLKTTPAKTTKEKPAKKSKTKSHKRKLLGTHWQDLTDKERETAIAPFRKVFPKDKFKITIIQKSFTVAYLGKTSQQNICKYHLLRLLETGKLEGVFVAHRFKTPEEFGEYLPEELIADRTLKQGDSCSYIHPFHQDEVMSLLKDTDFLAESIKRAQTQDKKMQANLANLEKTLQTPKDGKPVAKKSVKVVEPEEEEELIEEEVAPAKKPVKKPAPVTQPAKKPAAKKSVVIEVEEDEEEEVMAPKKAVKKPVKVSKAQVLDEEEELEEEPVVKKAVKKGKK